MALIDIYPCVEGASGRLCGYALDIAEQVRLVRSDKKTEVDRGLPDHGRRTAVGREWVDQYDGLLEPVALAQSCKQQRTVMLLLACQRSFPAKHTLVCAGEGRRGVALF